MWWGVTPRDSLCACPDCARFLPRERHSVIASGDTLSGGCYTHTKSADTCITNGETGRGTSTCDGPRRGVTRAFDVSSGTTAGTTRAGDDGRTTDDASKQSELALATDRPRARVGRSRQRRRSWKPTEASGCVNVKFRSARARYAWLIVSEAAAREVMQPSKRSFYL